MPKTTAAKSGRKSKSKSGDVPSARRVLEAIDFEIQPVKSTAGYKLGLCVVACFMIMIPVLYVLLIVCTAVGTYWHATHNAGLIGLGIWGLVLYLLPVVGGIVLVPFMIKPIFARQAYSQRPRRLKREAQPLLHDYVDQLCDAVGAPRPTSIRVMCDVNAGAGFRHGLISFFNGEVMLAIGLPLVSGLSLRQFSGVLAHEFGHFAQGTGRRLQYVIYGVNGWLARAAYERDSWDVWLFAHSKASDARLRPLAYVARFFVWCQRQIVQWLLWCGAVLSYYLSREMEFDADRYAVRTVGVRAVEQMLRKVDQLQVAHQFAMGDVGEFAREGRLADNLPKLIAANSLNMSKEMRQALRKRAHEQETSMFSTHPSDKDRVLSARAENDEGLFQSPEGRENLPASVLFDDFGRLCKRVTSQFYEEELGLRFKKRDLHPVDELLGRQEADIEAAKALHRYFQVHIPPLHPLPIAEDATERPENPQETGERLKAARQRMLDLVPEYRNLAKRYNVAHENHLLAISAVALSDGGANPDPNEYRLNSRGRRAASKRFEATRDAIGTLAAKLLPFETEAGERLSCALQLLRLKRVSSRVENGEELQYEVERLIEEAIFVSQLMAELPPFGILFRQTVALFSLLGKNDDVVFPLVVEKAQKIHFRLTSLYEELGVHLYPFDHAKADTTLQEWALPFVPEEHELGAMLEVSGHVFDRLVSVQLRLFARLAHAAEKVETALGLEPLPDPDEVAKRERERQEKESRSKRRRRRPTAEAAE